MTERYSNQRSFEDIKKFIGEIDTRVKEIRENEILLEKNLEDSIKLLVVEIFWLLGNNKEKILQTNDFYSLPDDIKKDVYDLIKDIFGFNCFIDDNPKL